MLEEDAKILARYIGNAEKKKPISKIEEQALFILYKKGNVEAREKLVLHNMRFVVKVALEYKYDISFEDLISEGTMGLMKAIDDYDPHRDLKFISYAVWWIRAYITNYIKEQGSTIRIPANQHIKISNALKKLTGDKKMDEDVLKLLLLRGKGVSFEAEISHAKEKHDHRSSTYGEVLPDTKNIVPELQIQTKKLSTILHSLIEKLPELEKKVINYIYDPDGAEPLSYYKIANILNYTPYEIKVFHKDALNRLCRMGRKYNLEPNFLNYIDALQLQDESETSI